jgi:hypothetical protein
MFGTLTQRQSYSDVSKPAVGGGAGQGRLWRVRGLKRNGLTPRTAKLEIAAARRLAASSSPEAAERDSSRNEESGDRGRNSRSKLAKRARNSRLASVSFSLTSPAFDTATTGGSRWRARPHKGGGSVHTSLLREEGRPTQHRRLDAQRGRRVRDAREPLSAPHDAGSPKVAAGGGNEASRLCPQPISPTPWSPAGEPRGESTSRRVERHERRTGMRASTERLPNRSRQRPAPQA